MPVRATLDHPVQTTADGRAEPEGEGRLVAPVAVRMFDLEHPLEDAHLVRGVEKPPYQSLLAVVRWGEDPLGVATFTTGDTACLPRERLIRGFSRRFDICQNELAARRGGDERDRTPHVSTWPPRLVSVVIDERDHVSGGTGQAGVPSP